MVDKLYIQSEDLFRDSLRLAGKILRSDFKPNFIIGIWRGGTPVGIAVQELLQYCGIETDHIAIRTSSYSGPRDRSERVLVHGLGYMVRNLNADDRLLIVDDVFDTGLSIDATIRELTERGRRNTPKEIKIATPWFKPNNNRTERIPDYFMHETDQWLVFPHEVQGLTNVEIRENKPFVAGILTELGLLDD